MIRRIRTARAHRSSRPRALVIGAAGQDGSYLCELLVEKGYEVTGVVRQPPAERILNLEGVRDDIRLVQADLADFDRLEGEIRAFEPDEIYNLGFMSFGPDAWSHPVQTAQIGTVAVCRLLEVIRTTPAQARFFQASSAWVFGRPTQTPQNERTPYAPVEPYGAAKAYGDAMVKAYRNRHGVFGCSGILYNHESPRRSERFVTRKITKAAAAIKLGLEDTLALGDMDSVRDWGYAKDFVEAAWLMLQPEQPEDYVVATGKGHTVRQFAEVAFDVLDLDWTQYVHVDAALRRAEGEAADLIGDATAARERLGWTPSRSFEDLVKLMVTADVRNLSDDPTSYSRPATI